MGTLMVVRATRAGARGARVAAAAASLMPQRPPCCRTWWTAGPLTIPLRPQANDSLRPAPAWAWQPADVELAVDARRPGPADAAPQCPARAAEDRGMTSTSASRKGRRRWTTTVSHEHKAGHFLAFAGIAATLVCYGRLIRGRAAR